MTMHLMYESEKDGKLSVASKAPVKFGLGSYSPPFTLIHLNKMQCNQLPLEFN